MSAKILDGKVVNEKIAKSLRSQISDLRSQVAEDWPICNLRSAIHGLFLHQGFPRLVKGPPSTEMLLAIR